MAINEKIKSKLRNNINKTAYECNQYAQDVIDKINTLLNNHDQTQSSFHNKIVNCKNTSDDPLDNAAGEALYALYKYYSKLNEDESNHSEKEINKIGNSQSAETTSTAQEQSDHLSTEQEEDSFYAFLSQRVSNFMQNPSWYWQQARVGPIQDNSLDDAVKNLITVFKTELNQQQNQQQQSSKQASQNSTIEIQDTDAPERSSNQNKATQINITTPGPDNSAQSKLSLSQIFQNKHFDVKHFNDNENHPNLKLRKKDDKGNPVGHEFKVNTDKIAVSTSLPNKNHSEFAQQLIDIGKACEQYKGNDDNPTIHINTQKALSDELKQAINTAAKDQGVKIDNANELGLEPSIQAENQANTQPNSSPGTPD